MTGTTARAALAGITLLYTLRRLNQGRAAPSGRLPREAEVRRRRDEAYAEAVARTHVGLTDRPD